MTSRPLILASASPRRRELLSWLGLHPLVLPPDVDETPRDAEEADAFVRRLARDKADACRLAHVQEAGDAWVLAADTVVVVDGELLGKPADRREAEHMLRRLSGRPHEVLTGVCLMSPGGGDARLRSVRTEVEFRDIREDEIAPYLDYAAWRDKAGGYAVQGVAAMFIRAIFGSWTNVMGLPLAETVEYLRDSGAVGPLPLAGAGRAAS